MNKIEKKRCQLANDMIKNKITLSKIKEIDKLLESQKIHISTREFFFKISLERTGRKNFTMNSHNLYIRNIKRVQKWYYCKYGDNNLKIPLKLRNRIYLISFLDDYLNGEETVIINENNPSVFQHVVERIGAITTSIPSHSIVREKHILCFNLFENMVKSGLNKYQVKSLDENTKNKIIKYSKVLSWFKRKFNVNNKENELFLIASHDYQSSIMNLKIHNYGCSAWSAQQACEKLLKGILKQKNIPYKNAGNVGHDINKLIDIFNENNMSLDVYSTFNKKEINKLNAAMRYSNNITSEDAYKYVFLFLDLLVEIKKLDANLLVEKICI